MSKKENEIKTEFNKACEDIEDFHDKLGEIFLDEFMGEDNTTHEIGKGIIYAFSCCETEREFEIADKMLIGICGWSIKTLISKIEEKDAEDYIWESCC